MDKSQLRRLALDFAHGDVDHESYVRERTELIDAIVAGTIAIEREPPTPEKKPRPPSRTEPDPDQTVELEAPVPTGPRLKPVHIVMGGIAIAVVAALILGGGDDAPPPAPQPVPETVTPTPAPQPAVPAARQLVDDFLAENFWGPTGLDRFTTAWQALSDQERSEAQSAPWFRPLTTALKQEINAQRALAGLDGGETTRAKGLRLVEFARTLGVAGPFPSFGKSGEAPVAVPVTPTPTPREEPASTSGDASTPGSTSPSEVTVVQSGETPAPTQAASATSTTTGTETTTSPSTPAPTGTSGTEAQPATQTSVADGSNTDSNGSSESVASADAERPWLDSLPDDAYALQLFAVRNLDEVTRLIEANPGQDLHVIPATSGDSAIYRVVTGPFDDAAAARAAFAGLPEALKRGETSALVRRVSSLRGAPPAQASTTSAPTPVVTAPTPSADGYTLQLLSSRNQEGVQRMVSQYPELPLRVHADGRTDETFRILYGDFPTPEAALDAVATLPESLLAIISGPPLVKSSAAPAGDVITIATRP